MKANNIEVYKSIIQESIRVKQSIFEDSDFLDEIEKVIILVTQAFTDGKKVLFCGNGGSAADAQHLAAEFSGRFYKNRPPLYSEALHVNSSYVTAVANDFSYDEIYARMIQAMGSKGDVLFAISTSGSSPNITRAIEEAKLKGMVVVGMTGAKGGKMNEMCDYIFRVPSVDTPRIQESHIMIGHIICYQVEQNLFND
ncbi:MAG: D-sedoheptulose 7-phosphate isomerase [Saprospiraceae bacterium]|jgi:D-sedoheptulose 7-phosphate isomerase|nr:D-sedoheptulose 7-phosphate isomerase [Saprospiraceae bacterium]